jgi:hypothetical protein
MKLSHIASAALLAGFAVQAGAAAPVDLGTVPPSVSFSATHTGAFEDIWTFNLGTPSIVAASLTNVEVSFLGNAAGGINDFQAWLNGTSLLPSGSTTTAGDIKVKLQVLAGAGSFAAGTYQLKVTGSGVTGGSGSYGGNLVATPIPEPETYALMLAGLGVVGFVAGRRRARV